MEMISRKARDEIDGPKYRLDGKSEYLDLSWLRQYNGSGRSSMDTRPGARDLIRATKAARWARATRFGTTEITRTRGRTRGMENSHTKAGGDDEVR